MLTLTNWRTSFSVGPTLQMIVEALQQNLESTSGQSLSAPLFKSGLTKAENVSVGDIHGPVNNVTHSFGPLWTSA